MIWRPGGPLPDFRDHRGWSPGQGAGRVGFPTDPKVTPILNTDAVASASASNLPGHIMSGQVWSYTNSASFSGASTIVYVRVPLAHGEIFDGMSYIQSMAGGGTRKMRMAVYDQAAPVSVTDVPQTRVATTAEYTLSGGDDGTLVYVAFTADFTVGQTGEYWLAIIADNTTSKYITVPAVDVALSTANFSRTESGGTTVLPVTAASAAFGGTFAVPLIAIRRKVA